MRQLLRQMSAMLAVALVIAAALLSLMVAWLWRNQERVVFQPPGARPDAPPPARRVVYRAADGQELFGYVLDAPGGNGAAASTVVIAFHGNADLAAWTTPWAHELATRAGVTVLLPELRGYAGIPGSPTYATAAADARAALDFARTELRPDAIVLFGHSLGSAIGTELAAQMEGAAQAAKAHMERAVQAPKALVLQSPFTSARDMATRMLVPPIPGLWDLIARVHYDTRARVAALDVPVHVSHGIRDLTVPARMGRAVHLASRRPGELLLVDGAGHNDVADVGGERYWRWLVSAVRPAPTR